MTRNAVLYVMGVRMRARIWIERRRTVGRYRRSERVRRLRLRARYSALAARRMIGA